MKTTALVLLLLLDRVDGLSPGYVVTLADMIRLWKLAAPGKARDTITEGMLEILVRGEEPTS